MPIKPITIIEISRRARQGATRPFLCRGDDDNLYWVKGNGAGKVALCREWLAGRIAQKLNLPIPAFEQVYVPDELIQYSSFKEISDLGAGFCFGSLHIQDATDLAFSNISGLEESFMRKLTLFDWWLQNEDRTLGQLGGNVNLLWSASSKNVYVIDHNLSFENDFKISKFRQNHVFSSFLENMQDLFLDEITLEFKLIFEQLGKIWSELPDCWVENAILSKQFDFGMIKSILSRYSEIPTEFRS